jgi:hypothetical protein
MLLIFIEVTAPMIVTVPLDKFPITANTGILTYKTIQTLAHNDAVIIVATDIVGHQTEQLIIVSVKENYLCR